MAKLYLLATISLLNNLNSMILDVYFANRRPTDIIKATSSTKAATKSGPIIFVKNVHEHRGQYNTEWKPTSMGGSALASTYIWPSRAYGVLGDEIFLVHMQY